MSMDTDSPHAQARENGTKSGGRYPYPPKPTKRLQQNRHH
jgi:hypothetical protein